MGIVRQLSSFAIYEEEETRKRIYVLFKKTYLMTAKEVKKVTKKKFKERDGKEVTVGSKKKKIVIFIIIILC